MRQRWIVLIIGVMSWGVATLPALAAAGGNSVLVKDTIASGGEYGASAAYVLPVGVLGASLGGPMSSDRYALDGGYTNTDGIRPIIYSLLPDTPTKPYIDEIMTIVADARDPQREPVDYQFAVDGAVACAWSSSATCAWTPKEAHLGRRTITVSARDPANNTATRRATVYIVRHPVEP